VPAGAEGPAAASPIRTRLTIFNLDTLEPIGEIDGVGGNGAAVDPKSGHGFTSSRPAAMFDTKTLKLIKTIDTATAQGDSIVFDAFNERVYVFSHPTKDATSIPFRHPQSGNCRCTRIAQTGWSQETRRCAARIRPRARFSRNLRVVFA
jgi:hypothetical protein